MYITVAEVAERLKISKSYAYELVKNKSLASLKIGRLVRVEEKALTVFLSSLTRESVGKKDAHITFEKESLWD